MDLFTDHTFKPQEIQEFLSELFPKMTFFNWNFTNQEPANFESDNQLHVNYHIEKNESLIEFQNCITIYRMPIENMQQRFLYIGKKLSDKYNVRVLVGFTIPEKEFDPYWNIIFKNEKSYLAEDFDTNFGGFENNNMLKMDNQYRLEIKEFNEYGNIKSQ